MNLPNYFLADLPAEAALTPVMIREACQTLKRNRAQYLATRSTASLIRVLHELGEAWMQAGFPFRKLALSLAPGATGFSAATVNAGLDSFFSQLRGDHLEALIAQDLGHVERLDGLVRADTERKPARSSMAMGPELLVHITGGQIPNPTLTSIVLGFLVRSAQFVKCASGSSLLPRLFAHSLYEVEPKIGACLELAEWRGGDAALEDALFAESDCVTATGLDETLSGIRQHLPGRVRFLAYGHRLSFGYVTREAVSGYELKSIIASTATDVVAWDQLGCLSPHVIYVEQGGHIAPEQFAELLAAELERRETTEPARRLSVEDAAQIAYRRAMYDVRAAHVPDTRHWASANSTGWTVVYESDPRFQISCMNRFIYVKSADDLTQALRGADGIFGKVSTVGLAAPESRARAMVLQLAAWGVSRVCPLGKMQHPALAWRHDGRPCLADLVHWVDWEQ